MLGDRLGGVIFDIQQYRSFKRAGVPLPDCGNPVRAKWIEYCSEFLGIIEAMDEKELREPERAPESNPRIGTYERCKNIEHDRYQQRKTDCTECFPPEQASLTSSLANLNEPEMKATICACKEPVCNAGKQFPKGCYECGGIVLAPTKTKEHRGTDAWPTQVNTDVLETVPAKTCVCPGRRGQPGSHCLTCGGTCDGVQR